MTDHSMLLDVTSKMKLFSFPSLAAIYGSRDEHDGELVGSGTFINIRGETYLLTAGHIASEKNNYKRLVHTRSIASSPAWLTNHFHVLNQFLDICIVKIDSDNLKGTTIIPVDIARLAHQSNYLEGDILFTHGYPGAKNISVNLLDTDFSKTQPFCTFIAHSVYPWFDSQYHFALDYSQTGQLDDPHGLSGSAVWKTNIDNSTAHWSPLNAEIVGVVHHWDGTAHSLIATRIEIVRKFLLNSLRSEFAYYHWLERGSPLHDDLNDWFIACKEIPKL